MTNVHERSVDVGGRNVEDDRLLVRGRAAVFPEKVGYRSRCRSCEGSSLASLTHRGVGFRPMPAETVSRCS
jgi:hypothetical protein